LTKLWPMKSSHIKRKNYENPTTASVGSILTGDRGDKSKIGNLGVFWLTSANQRSVVSEIGHNCMQTSRHWGVN